ACAYQKAHSRTFRSLADECAAWLRDGSRELRDSRTVLREPRGGTPRGYSPGHGNRCGNYFTLGAKIWGWFAKSAFTVGSTRSSRIAASPSACSANLPASPPSRSSLSHSASAPTLPSLA